MAGGLMEVVGTAEVIAMFDEMRETVSVLRENWVVGTEVEYSVYVELGTSTQEAQPYLFPAAQEGAMAAAMILDQHGSLDGFVEELALFIERRAKEKCPVDTGNLRASIAAEPA